MSDGLWAMGDEWHAMKRFSSRRHCVTSSLIRAALAVSLVIATPHAVGCSFHGLIEI